jgi:hypothetical protein
MIGAVVRVGVWTVFGLFALLALKELKNVQDDLALKSCGCK